MTSYFKACLGDWPTFDCLPQIVNHAQLKEQLQQIHMGIQTSMAKQDWNLAAKLHYKLLSALHGSKVPEPHQIHVNVRNSLQCVLWKMAITF